MRPLLVCCAALSLTAAAPRGAAGQPADTSRISEAPLFTPSDLLIAGGFVLGTIAMYPADRHFALQLQDSTTQAIRVAREAAKGFNFIAQPGSYLIGGALYTAGRISDNREMADLGLHGTEAVVLGQAVAALIKFSLGRARPYLDERDPNNFKAGRGLRREEYRSFPSGHTTTGFAAAAAVTAETRRFWPEYTWLIAPVMYGGASLIGLSRMYDNKHWASDVVTGAAIGTFAGLKVVRYHHTHPNNRIDKWLLATTVVPLDDGMALAFTFRTR